MSDIVRSFSPEGTALYSNFIGTLKSNPSAEPPYALLEDPKLTNLLPGSPTINSGSIATKMDLAQRIESSVGDFVENETNPEVLEGMWNWLSLYFFETITNGRKNFGRPERFILNRLWSRRSKHLVESSFNAFKLHGSLASVILKNDPWKGGEVFNNLSGTQEYWVNQGLFKTVHVLYWDDQHDRPKSNITTEEKPGTIRRLIKVLNQLRLTYDLFAFSSDDFDTLIPNEFDRWRNAKNESN